MLVFYFREQVHRLTFDQSCSHYAMQDLPVQSISFVFGHPDLSIRTQKPIKNGTLHLISRHQDRLTVIGGRELFAVQGDKIQLERGSEELASRRSSASSLRPTNDFN
ncbi:MAG: hypothetical protein V7703_22000 [Hyphomicrobiales bacterium]